jgi:hypothetical protein
MAAVTCSLGRKSQSVRAAVKLTVSRIRSAMVKSLRERFIERRLLEFLIVNFQWCNAECRAKDALK